VNDAIVRAGRDKVATRARILEAAMEVFGERGYAAASMDEIARRAGNSKGGVYFHFPSKQAIFEALIGELAALLASAVREAIERQHGALARVDAALGTAIRTFSANRGLARLLLIEANGLGQAFEREVRSAHALFVSVIASYLDRAVSEGAIPPLDTTVAGCVWLGAVHEVVLRWLHEDQEPRPPLEDTLPALRAMLLRSIGVAGGT